MKKLSVAVIGAGIVGLAYAWSAAARGHRVTIFERHPRARGASVRNFGMVWPIGQPHGELYQTALVSRQKWLELGQQAGIWVDRCGSLHLAYQDDERAVLQEFAQAAADTGIDCRWTEPAAVLARSPAANPDGLLGGLYSPIELCVNPRAAIAQTAMWLEIKFDVEFHYSTMVSEVQPGTLRSGLGRRWDFDRIIVCGGTEVQTLFPDQAHLPDVRLCKLQMLCTDQQPSGWRIGPHLAGGLTLRHYKSFENCPSLSGFKQRIASEKPELDRFGIHVMASQNEQGQVILGDSHEYDQDIEPFDKERINSLILQELRTIMRLPNWSIAERWHGMYAKHSGGPIVRSEPMPEVHIRTGTGGAGMTLSFGLAEADWTGWSESHTDPTANLESKT